jgi:hypothetical protein
VGNQDVLAMELFSPTDNYVNYKGYENEIIEAKVPTKTPSLNVEKYRNVLP